MLQKKHAFILKFLEILRISNSITIIFTAQYYGKLKSSNKN